jgi:oligosaccharide repeat unit polymerase
VSKELSAELWNDKGKMRILYLFMIAILLGSFWKVLVKLRHDEMALTPILGWILGLAFFILAPLTLIVLHGGYEIPPFYEVNDSYSKVDLATGEFFIPILAVWASLLFSFLAVLSFTPAAGESRQRFRAQINESSLKKTVIVTASLTIFTYVTTIQMVGGLGIFLVSHWYNRQEELVARLGDLYVLFSQFSQANQILFTAAAVLFTHIQVKRRKFDWRFSVLILFFFLLQIAVTGNRIFFALYLMSFAASCWLYRRKRPIVILLAVAPLLIFVFSAWNFFRHDLSTIGKDISAYTEGDLGSRSVTSLMDAFEGIDTMILLHMINDFGSKYDYLYGGSYARILYFLVPRSVYPEKPAGFSVRMAALYEPGNPGSLAVTQFGECYANFGPFSLLLFPLVTAAVMKFSASPAGRMQNHALLSAVVFVLFIWVARSSFEDNFITFVLAFVLSGSLRLEKGLTSDGAVWGASGSASI